MTLPRRTPSARCTTSAKACHRITLKQFAGLARRLIKATLARSLTWALFGQGVPQDYVGAYMWFSLAASRATGDQQKLYSQGRDISAHRMPPQQIAEAQRLAREWKPGSLLSLLKWAADRGDVDAQINLGLKYHTGERVPQDYAEAVRWIRKAADQGDARGQALLGAAYEDGQGVPKDFGEAARWYRKSADQGNSVAQENLERVTHQMEQQSRASQASASLPAQNQAGTTFEVALEKRNGVLLIPVLINNKIPLDFVIDSGAADVSIPADVVLTLMRTGTLTAEDFTGTNTYTLADGSKVPSQAFRIRSLNVGDRVLENVSGSVASVNGELLLGQSFLSRFKSWSIDNGRQILVLQ